MSVSDTIGKLLLEGYKMLADSCDVCYTVLMKDRRGRIICVNCESKSMANAAFDEIENGLNARKLNNGNGTDSRSAPTNPPDQSSSNIALSASTVADESEKTLMKEIQKASERLERYTQPNDVQQKLGYVKYIRECAETIKALQALKHA